MPDLRYAIRGFLKNPGFTVVAVLALALGIGANTAIFSVINGVLLKPLPSPDPERLTLLWEKSSQMEVMSISVANLRDWRAMNRSFEEIGAFRVVTVNLTGTDRPRRLEAEQAEWQVFPAVGIAPMLGRVYTAADDHPGAEPSVVISHELWSGSFGGDSSIVGRPIMLDGRSYTVLGVMPPAMGTVSQGTDLWIPLGLFASELPPQRDHHAGLFAWGRLKPGVTLASAQADMSSVARGIGQEHKEVKGNDVVVVSAREELVEDIEPALVVIFTVVGFVLLIACVNVANLLLARASAREREIAIRTALGAGRMRIVRQLLTESVLLAVLGGALGLLLALAGIEAILASVPEGAVIPLYMEVKPDLPVLAFTLGVALLSAIAFGLVPALQATGRSALESLRAGGRGVARPSGKLRAALVISETAMAMMLLVGAGLMLKSFTRLMSVDPGFHTENVASLWIDLPERDYPDVERWVAFHDRLLERLRAVPGVRVAAFGTSLPLTGGKSESGVFAKDAPPKSPDDALVTFYQAVSPDYIPAMGIRLLKGRGFTPLDREGSTPVAIIDRTLAESLWPGQDPLGKLVAFEFNVTPEGNKGVWREVVGVTESVRYYELGSPSRVQAYAPYTQLPVWMRDQRPPTALVARTQADPSTVLPELERQVAAIDPNVPVYDVATMDRVLDRHVAPQRLTTWLVGFFSVTALLLATIGLYGVIAYSVRLRTRELGIRIALGAGRRDLLQLVVREGMLLALTGIAIGTAVALAVAPLLADLLFGVSPADPFIFAAIALLLVVTAAIASYIPARRAAAVDPMVALRYE